MKRTFDFGKVNSVDDLAGANRPEPGHYHAQISAVEKDQERDDLIHVEFAVLAPDDTRGKRLNERFYLSEKAVPRFERMLLSTGFAKPGARLADPDFQGLVGRQCVIEVISEEYEKDGETRTATKLSYKATWPLGHPETKDVPRGEPFTAGNTPDKVTVRTSTLDEPDGDEWSDF